MPDMTVFTQSAWTDHLTPLEQIEAEEAEAIRHHIHTVRLYREIIAGARDNMKLLDAEVLDRCLPGWDAASILGTLDDLMCARLTDKEVRAMAGEAFWAGQDDL